MAKQSEVRAPAIPFTAAAMDSVGVVMRAASAVPIILCAIHEDAILPLGFSHGASKQPE